MERQCGCLLIHGFGGSVFEVAPLAERLRLEGYQVVTPMLKGHTGRRRDLKSTNYAEWIASAEEGLKELEGCRSIFLLGFSMGGLIAANLTLKYDVAGLVTLNSPIYFWNFRQIFTNIIEDVKHLELKHIKRYLQSYRALPIPAMQNFRVLLAKSRKVVKRIDCPLLVIQGTDDDTVRKISGNYIYENALSENKELKFYGQSGHVILHSPAARYAIEDILHFIDRNKIDAPAEHLAAVYI